MNPVVTRRDDDRLSGRFADSRVLLILGAVGVVVLLFVIAVWLLRAAL